MFRSKFSKRVGLFILGVAMFLTSAVTYAEYLGADIMHSVAFPIETLSN